MEHLIKQIEALKYSDNDKTVAIGKLRYYNDALDDVIMKIRNQPVIKAKAFRHISTGDWVEFSNTKYWYPTKSLAKAIQSVEDHNYQSNPTYCELIDIEILDENTN